MTNEPTRNDFLTGDFISENAVRGVLGRRRRAAPTTQTEPPNDLPATPTTASGKKSPPDGPRALRRWSVAELIARAGAAPPRRTA